MRRIGLVVCAVAVAAVAAVPGAFGFASGFDYVGQVEGTDLGTAGFFAARPAPGKPKRVSGFTVTSVPYSCSDAPTGVTTGWRFKPKMRVGSHRRFEGEGDWVGLPLDPVGTVSGRFRPGGTAVGEFKLRGELGGPGTHCRTGLLSWQASKNDFPAR